MYVLTQGNLWQIANNCPRPCALGITENTDAWVATENISIAGKATAG